MASSPSPSVTPTPTTSPTPTPTPVPQPTPTPTPDKWILDEDQSSMDDTLSVTAFLRSDNEQRANSYSSTHATLVVRCQERETDVYINVDTFISTQPTRVRYRLDEEKAREETWSVSTDYKAFFVRGAIAFARKLAASQKFVLRFTPHGDSPLEYEFDVRGLAPHLAKIAKACNWKP
ncbi:MAG: type VI secretion system-associated protein TagO [Micropepsaceae bacterium]